MEDPKEDKNITPDTDIWKFRSREVKISEMDKASILYAALHCMKRIYYYNKQIHYSNYRLKVEKEDKVLARFERKKKKSEDVMEFFAGKLEQLEERALEIGFEVPDKFEDLKDLLSEVDKKEKQEN